MRARQTRERHFRSNQKPDKIKLEKELISIVNRVTLIVFRQSWKIYFDCIITISTYVD